MPLFNKVFFGSRKLMNTHVFKLTFKIRQHRHTVFFIAPYFRKFRIAKISFYVYGMTVIPFYIPNGDIPQTFRGNFPVTRSRSVSHKNRTLVEFRICVDYVLYFNIFDYRIASK